MELIVMLLIAMIVGIIVVYGTTTAFVFFAGFVVKEEKPGK